MTETKIDTFQYKSGERQGQDGYSTKIGYLTAARKLSDQDESMEFVAKTGVMKGQFNWQGKTIDTYKLVGTIGDKDVFIQLTKSAADKLENLGVVEGNKVKITATGEKFAPYNVEVDGASTAPASPLLKAVMNNPVGLSPKETEFMQSYKASLMQNDLKKEKVGKETFMGNAEANGLVDKTRNEELWEKL